MSGLDKLYSQGVFQTWQAGTAKESYAPYLACWVKEVS